MPAVPDQRFIHQSSLTTKSKRPIPTSLLVIVTLLCTKEEMRRSSRRSVNFLILGPSNLATQPHAVQQLRTNQMCILHQLAQINITIMTLLCNSRLCLHMSSLLTKQPFCTTQDDPRTAAYLINLSIGLNNTNCRSVSSFMH